MSSIFLSVAWACKIAITARAMPIQFLMSIRLAWRLTASATGLNSADSFSSRWARRSASARSRCARFTTAWSLASDCADLTVVAMTSMVSVVAE